jgi:hypothetical protein
MKRSLPPAVELVPVAVDPDVPVAPPMASAGLRQPTTVTVPCPAWLALVLGEAVVCAATPAVHASANAATPPIHTFLIRASLLVRRNTAPWLQYPFHGLHRETDR